MTTGTPFQPTPLSTTVVAPQVTSLLRRVPYIGATEFRNAPTAVATNALVPGGNAAANLQALADVIMRASGWLDLICFHNADGTLAASPSTESAYLKPKTDGTLVLVCKYRPILELTAVALGTSPSQAQSVTTAPDASFGTKTITLPNTPLGAITGDFPAFPSPTNAAGQVYAVWQYVNGFPHTYLAANCLANASSISVGPSVVGGTAVFGVYPGTQLTIHDGVNTETVVVSSVSGTTLNLSSPTVYAHTVPTAPDSIRVSAVPWAVEQACISLTSCLIKTRGTHAAVLPMQPGPAGPARDALIEAGGLEDFEVACKLLKPFTTVYAGNA